VRFHHGPSPEGPWLAPLGNPGLRSPERFPRVSHEDHHGSRLFGAPSPGPSPRPRPCSREHLPWRWLFGASSSGTAPTGGSPARPSSEGQVGVSSTGRPPGWFLLGGPSPGTDPEEPLGLAPRSLHPGPSSVQDGESAHQERLPDPDSSESWSRSRSAGCLPWLLLGGSSGLIHGAAPVEPSSEGSSTGHPTGCSPGGSSSEEPPWFAAHEVYSVGLPGASRRTSFRGPPPGACPGRAPFQRLLGASTLGTSSGVLEGSPSSEGCSTGPLS
jgi:hypothetical protein